MPILRNNKHEVFAHPGYNCASWRRRHRKPDRSDRSFRLAAAPSVVDANVAAKMEGELNTIASELLEGIKRDDESRREHLEMPSEGFRLPGLVIETATATSVSSSEPLDRMSTVRHPLLLEACSLFQSNAMGEMLPAAGPVKVRGDRTQKPKSADMMGHNDGPALDCTNQFSTPPAASAGTSYAGNPPSPASALPAAVPASSRCRRDAAPTTVDCRACPGDGCACRSWPYARLGRAPPTPATPVIPEEQESDAIEDALEKDMNHYLIFLANAPNLRSRCDDHLALALAIRRHRSSTAAAGSRSE